MAATHNPLSFASVILAVSPYVFVIHGCEIHRSDLLKGCHSDQALYVSGSRREYTLSYSSDDDLSALAADAEGKMARFVANTFERVVD